MLASDGTTALVTVNGSGSTTTPTPVPGVGLTAITPAFEGEGLVYRIRTTGTYYARVTSATAAANDYALSISKNCAIPTADLARTKTDTPDPVTAGSDITYTMTVTNNGTIAVDAVTVNCGPATARGIVAEANGSAVPGVGDVFTVNNDGNLIVRQSSDGGATWYRGMAIDVSNAANNSVINLLSGRVFGNIDVQSGDPA